MKYNFVKCLEPRHVFNKYTGETILAECGKCEACLLKKSLARKTRCQLESLAHKYQFFVTLTYSNKFLPLVSLVNVDEDSTPNLYHVFRFRSNIRGKPVYGDGAYLGKVSFKNDVDKYQLMKKCNVSSNPNVFPVLDTKDIQLFLKRLRKILNEKIRVFYCGEYGPVHFRPHWHLLLWFDDEETLSKLREVIRACWSFGRVDASLSFGKSNGYLASYVNSNQYLPRLFTFPGTKPLSNHSWYLGESVLEGADEVNSEYDFARIVRQRVFGNGINTDLVLWRSLKTRLMPKCQGYSLQSQFFRLVPYKAYATIRTWTQEDCPIRQARFITDYVRYFDFYHEIPEVAALLQYFRQSLNYYVRNKDGIKLLQPCLVDYDKFERCIYKKILLSRHFLERICHGDMNLIPCKLGLIDKFYKYLDYENLKQQLEIVEISSKKLQKENLRFFYHNSFVVDDLKNLSCFKRYSQTKKYMFSSFMKHKELNDKNKLFHYG